MSELWIAGVDEVGRGPLAGPLVVAAVIPDPRRPVEGLADSKALSAQARERLAAEILAAARCVVVEEVAPEEVDRSDVLAATMAAMARAVRALDPRPTLVRVDGNRAPDLGGLACQTIVGGDAVDPAISAASIVAKVHRDARMLELAERWPGYGFERHKGYGTAEHLAALHRLGPCPAHRRSCLPVRQPRLFE